MHTTQKTNNMEEKKEQRKFEFTLYLNDNIIVQRFFNIIGFNNKAINSMNFKYAIDENVELIQSVLKDRALDFITEHQRHFLETPDYEQNGSKDMMKIVVKHDGNVIAYREWDATIYPVKVRYTVDIRPHLKRYLADLTTILSSQRLETTYLTYQL